MQFTILNMLISLLNTNKRSMKRYASLFALTSVILLWSGISYSNAFTYHWEIDETPEGSESATVIEPIEVTLLDEPIQVAPHSASLALMRKYSVYLGPEWNPGHAYRLLQTFESIPQETNNLYAGSLGVASSIWRLSDRHIQDDISVEYRDGRRIVSIAEDAFVHAEPLLAEIESVRGRYFSKRLHHAVVRFVTDDGVDRYALERILQERYAVEPCNTVDCSSNKCGCITYNSWFCSNDKTERMKCLCKPNSANDACVKDYSNIDTCPTGQTCSGGSCCKHPGTCISYSPFCGSGSKCLTCSDDGSCRSYAVGASCSEHSDC